MPWVKIGRYRFDLDDIALVADVVGGEKLADPGPGVTITLRTRMTFDLIGDDASRFARIFDEHVAARSINKGPPRAAIGTIVVPEKAGGKEHEQETGKEHAPHGEVVH